MPRPYFIPRERRDPQSERLAQLAAIAQVMQGFQGQQQQAQSDQQRNALGVLGLVLNNQREEAQLAQQKAYQDAVLGEQRNRGSQELKQILASKLLDDPNIPLDQKRAALTELDPSFVKPLDAMHEAALVSAAQKRTPEFAAVYESGKNDPEKLAKGINALRMVTTDEEFNRQPWERLNQGLPEPKASQPGFLSRLFSSAPAPTSKPVVNTPVPLAPYSALESPAVAAARRQYEQQTGRKVTAQSLKEEKLAAIERARQKLLQQYGLTE